MTTFIAFRLKLWDPDLAILMIRIFSYKYIYYLYFIFL